MGALKKVDTGVYRGPRVRAGDLVNGTEKISYTLALQTSQKLIGDTGPLAEAIEGDAVGLRCYAHPLGALLPPTLEELKLAVKLIRIRKDGGIYVHCEHGVDRTGMVIAAYRILVQEWPVEQAIKEMLDNGFHRAYFYWIPQLWRL